MTTANTMRSDLHSAIVTVTFTKDSGESRVMICTLHSSIVPKEANARALRDDLVIAWDMEADGWRTFKPASVTSWDVGNCLR